MVIQPPEVAQLILEKIYVVLINDKGPKTPTDTQVSQRCTDKMSFGEDEYACEGYRVIDWTVRNVV